MANIKQFEVDTSDLINNLRLFNAKERFFLVGHILGKQDFKPSENFIGQLSNALGFNIPENVFAAMDYHLDWLYASLKLAAGHSLEDVCETIEGTVKGQQEDVDFIIAFKDSDKKVHIVLIEAKGVTGWLPKQIQSKADRLGSIFRDNNKLEGVVIPHFVFMSPQPPVIDDKDVLSWPEWMKKSSWIKLETPEHLLCVTRCTKDGRPATGGGHWKAEAR